MESVGDLPVISSEAASRKRIFISGIAANLSKDELVARLRTYGSISRDLDLNTKNQDTTGVFGHCDLDLTPTSWARLRKLSGTVLKGKKLRIEEAKQDWIARKQADLERPEPKVPGLRKRPTPGTTLAIESKRVKRGEVIKDSQITQKSRSKGWIKGRYGRALAILKRDGEPPLKRNPDALSKLWGVAHPRPDQLTAYYDSEEDEWHDRAGRVIREVEITKKNRTVEVSNNSRVEIWDSEDEADPCEGGAGEAGEYTTASSSRPDYAIDESPALPEEVDEEAIEKQLAGERSLALGMLGDMFKDSDAAEVVREERKAKQKVRDKLDIIKRFDPNAPESDSDPESETNAAQNNVAEALSESTKDTTDAPSEDLQETRNDMQTSNTAHDSDDESDALPAFLRAREDHVNTADLTSIFKPSTELETAPFKLFGDVEETADVESDEAMPDIHPAADVQDIHPDRLNRPNMPDHVENEGNANYTALAKDRGFELSSFATPGVFPLLLSSGEGSIWHGATNFFGPTINFEDVKRRWEESRGDVTRDWKRKRREGQKMRRKAIARQGR